MNHDNFQPPEDPAHDEWVREQQAEAHWEKQLTDAYAEGRADERAEWAGVLESLKNCLHMLERADCSTGYCCCGSPVEAHGIGTGHSPVDRGDYRLSATIEAARAALAKAGG